MSWRIFLSASGKIDVIRWVGQASIWLVLFSAVAGCGDSDEVAVHPVSGKVLHRGEPAAGAKVVLYAVDRKYPKVPFPTGSVCDGLSSAMFRQLTNR